ncbi:MAG: PLP-dependent aminotransferase family protein [Gemmatimonadaceae bacterium]|nr:PLP-dependent aminotransferase family protein [Gemmatimonadaceae bacterium]
MRPSPLTQSASRAPAIAILISPDRQGMPLYTQLYRQLREHILSGSLPPGALLPSARVLAADLQISRNTVEAAIEQLSGEGFVTRRVGVGTRVLNVKDAVPFLPRPRQTQGTTARARPSVVDAARQTAPVVLSELGELLQSGGQIEIDSDRHMGACTTDISRFPAKTWNRLLAKAARDHGRALLSGGELQGDRALREAISEHARLTRGLRCTPEQVLVLNSTQQAIDLAGRLLLNPNDVALVEEPGYLSARAALQTTGAEVRGVPVDRDGVNADQLARYPRARLLYLTPSHQFPLGHTLSLSRRLTVLEWARSNDAWIIEDDYDSEFRYVGRPIAALQGLDSNERVLYVGTFNKVLFPGIRLAYLVLPHALIKAFLCARRLTDGGSPPLIQSALAAFLTAGHFTAHLRRARRFYEARRDVLINHLHARCGAAVQLGVCETGLHLTVHLPAGTDDRALAIAGAGYGLGVAPLSRYYVECQDQSTIPRGLLLSYGGASESSIRASIDAFAPLLTANAQAAS